MIDDTRIRDVIIIALSVTAIFACLYFMFGTVNPIYVVSSGSMTPALNVYDAIVVSSKIPWTDIDVDDIIVFNRPLDHLVIVHRVIGVAETSIGKTIMTKGDANIDISNGTDFPITEDLYIGKVVYVIPYVGHLALLLQPPYNYITIIVIFVLIALKLKY